MIEKLKPCPFCGGKAQYYDYYEGIHFYGIQCTKCIKVVVDRCFTKKEAREIWNRRVNNG